MADSGTDPGSELRLPPRPRIRDGLAVTGLLFSALLDLLRLPFHVVFYLFRRRKIQHDMVRSITGGEAPPRPPRGT